MLDIFPSSLFLLVKWITIYRKPFCRKRNLHLGSKTESLGKMLISPPSPVFEISAACFRALGHQLSTSFINVVCPPPQGIQNH